MPWPQLRTCQQEAVDRYMADRKGRREWLAMLTPGAGKTIFALYVAATLKEMGVISRVAVYVPSDSLRQQWADVASVFGLELLPVKDPSDYNDRESDGFVATYAQMNASGAERAFRAVTSTPTLAILDEVHHLGDNKTWGEGTQRALTHAENILMLTGTPWRSDDCPIPWCRYDAETGRVLVDFAYEYGNAVADNVCRAVEIHAYDGQARYLDNATEITKSLRDTGTGRELGRMFDAVFDPEQEWTPALLNKAHQLLVDRRRDVPDAGGLVVTDSKETAKAIAKLLTLISGQEPTVVISEDDHAVEKLNGFREDGSKMWLVAIRMVSEGVDVPRLMVGCYLSRWKTPLFFRQYVGRFVRTRPECPPHFDAHIIIPAVSVLMELGTEIEQELRDQLSRFDDDELDADDAAEAPVETSPTLPIPQQRHENTAGGEAEQAELFDLDGNPAFMDGPEAQARGTVILEAGSAEFYRSDRRGIGQPAKIYLPGHEACLEHNIPTTYARHMAEFLATQARIGIAAPIPPPAAPMPAYKKKDMIRAEVDRHVDRLARMQCRRNGNDSTQERGKRQTAINTDLMRRFGARPDCTTSTLKRILDHLATEIKKEAARDGARRRTHRAR
ncbi:ATP-dependent helicase [Streptomyces inhibens]|uniref:ATP-dependent helicase n=1 Tax=Streptomyces inhibens TaxID=2293571 RepID=A0A371Q4D0_STRIH|nr:DEAD/DEAH box helicase family protein [Streptomyces inhibens]REK89557.1 ATP-dependent helicase [Streptomyces inhibens]